MTLSTIIEAEDENFASEFANDIMVEMTKKPIYGKHIAIGNVTTDEV